ncbi:hypothetical protein QTP86_007596 [Hemibagrus guttatus]|nr:hypothetical protein QTP86_007596 [Hemibagrus guttatus]
MEKDYRTALGKFWQTVRRLRRGKQLSANTVYGGDGELLVSTGDIVGRWKEYFEDLLNPTDTPSVEEPEAGDSEVDSFITQAEVTEVVQQLLGGKAPGVDEIRPEYLKSLDVVGLSWLTSLCNIAWRSGTVPLDWATGVVVPLFKKGDWREEQCGFRPSRGTLDQLYTLHRVLEGSWEFAQPFHMCFVDLEKAFDRVPHGILWEVLWEYGVHGPLLRAVWSLYNRSRSLVRIASCLDLQHALGHFAAECEAAGMRVSTSKSEAMVLDRKKVACTLQVGGEVLPQVEEFKYLGVLFTSEGRMDREIDRRIGAAAAIMQSMYRSVVVKKELSWKAKLSIYQSIYIPTLTYGHELWVMTERIRSRIQAAEMSFLRRVAGRSLRDRSVLDISVLEVSVLRVEKEPIQKCSRMEGVTFMDLIKTDKSSGGRRTQVDYILCRRGNLKEISDCKVVVGESVARQHRMVVCRMTLMVCKKKRSEIEKKTKWWKLKKEECCEEFRQKLRQVLGGQVVLPDDWETTAEVIRETGRKVLGVSSGRRKEDKETWWWNEEVQDSVQRKWDMDRTEENKQEYKELQHRVKREVSKAKQKAYDELYTRLDTREGEKDLYRLARQRDQDGKDVQQVRVIKDRDGRVLTSEESVQRRWKEYFEELMNEENEREKE